MKTKTTKGKASEMTITPGHHKAIAEYVADHNGIRMVCIGNEYFIPYMTREELKKQLNLREK